MIILTPAEFLDYRTSTAQFDALFISCLRNRLSLLLEIGEEDVRIYAEEKGLAQTSHEVIEASFIDDVVPPIKGGIGANLLTPLIAPTVKMVLPAQQIYAHRSGKRSIADFFMRNLFYAICRKKDAQLTTAVGAFKVPPTHVHLAKRYLWILRSAFSDKVLHEKNLFEMLILNTRLPILVFESLLLSGGAECHRSAILNLDAGKQRAVTDFDQIRGEVMGLLP
jgi:hypothetical protein